jgi:hypothetical protein
LQIPCAALVARVSTGVKLPCANRPFALSLASRDRADYRATIMNKRSITIHVAER